MLSKIRLRMKLSDFINTDREKEIMEMIDKTHRDLTTTILLHLWYKDDINPNELKNFLLRWEDKLHFRTIVKQTSDLEPYEFVFFDIIPAGIAKSQRYRFAYTYTDNDRIIEGLDELYACLKFINIDKPTKRQKRNDYED